MREIDKIIMAAREANASDIHITKGLYLLYRVKGTLVHAPMQPTPEETEDGINILFSHIHLGLCQV